MVAMAAPRTPQWNTKIKIGSSIILLSAPMSTAAMLRDVKPCAVMNRFSPIESMTNTEPAT